MLRFKLMVKRNEVRVFGLKHQKEKRSMNYFAGLDVSVKNTSVCIVDEMGKIVRLARNKRVATKARLRESRSS